MTLKYIPITQLVPRSLRILSRFAKVSDKVKNLADSIAKYGLFFPLSITGENGKYTVIEGKKRLEAVSYLSRIGKLPRSLEKLPCVLTDARDGHPSLQTPQRLQNDYELAALIWEAKVQGLETVEILKRLYCSQHVVEQALSLKGLHGNIESLFLKDLLSLNQVSALATLPNPASQWRLLEKIGPFSSHDDIIEAIQAGKTVLDLPTGEVLILPSRQHWPLPTALGKQGHEYQPKAA